MGHTPPTIVAGKYEVLGRLGEGGQGSVWKVRHVELDQVRAMKWQPDEGIDDSASRFRREGLALARLRHPHIVEVFDFGRDADAHYLIMQYVEGENLAQRFRTRGRPTLPDALAIGRQVADALSYSHRQPYVDSQGRRHEGMIHRDIKPSNILLRDQVQMHVLLADFGLVKLGDPGERTTTGAVMGTYKYSAPEQLGLRRGRERVAVDLRADVFAFGLVLYELLEGRQFHEGLDMGEVLGRVLYEDLEPEFRQPISANLRALVTTCIRRFPEERPERMDVVLRELELAIADLHSDETQTRFVPHADQDIDQQIAVLLRERDRRRVQTAQSAAQAARKQATAVEAETLAAEPFGRAVEADDQAAVAMRDGDNTEAREGYERAAALYAQAGAAAIVARQRRELDALLALVAERRGQAESAGAAEHAKEAFGRARKHDDGARAALARGEIDGIARDLRAAEADYADAAREAAAARARREAKAARQQLAKQRREAEAVDAARLAARAFELGCGVEMQAEAALAAGDVLAARDLYTSGAEAFAGAAADAARERDRRVATAARHDAARARAASEEAGAPELAGGAHDAGLAVFAEGEAAFGRDDHRAAVDAYGRAVEAFASAVDAARARILETARAQASGVRGRAEAARANALAGGTAEADLAAGDGAWAAGESLVAREDFGRAEAEYARARILYEEALASARRTRAEEAGRQADLARDAAAHEQAEPGAGATCAAAETELARARAALAAERYDEATGAFARAAAIFARAAAEAGTRRAEARAARTETLVARAAVAADAADWAPEAVARAQALLREADELLAAGDGVRAAADFATARDAFAAASSEVEARRAEAAARRQEAADGARRRAESARTAARAAGADVDAVALVEQAALREKAGTEALAAGDHAAAERAFVAAAEGYEAAAAAGRAATDARARRQAEERQRAERAQTGAEAARVRAGATSAATDAGAELDDATRRWDAGVVVLRQGDYPAATRAFDEAAAAYAAAARVAAAAVAARAEAEARAAAEARAEADARARADTERRAAELQAERRARQEAQAQARAREAASGHRRDAETARDDAVAAGAEGDATRTFAAATAAFAAAGAAVERGEYEAAAQGFTTAASTFGDAAEQARAAAAARARAAAEARAAEEALVAALEAARRAREAAAGRRSEAEYARDDAVRAGAERDAPRAFAGAVAGLTAAIAAFERGDYDAAAQGFAKEVSAFGDAAEQARGAAAARAHAEAEAAARAAAERAQAERRALESRERAEAARKGAVSAGAERDAAVLLAAADAEGDAAKAALARADLAAAARGFEDAARSYGRAGESALAAAKARAQVEAAEAQARAAAAAKARAAEAERVRRQAEAERKKAADRDAERTRMAVPPPVERPADDRTQISARVEAVPAVAAPDAVVRRVGAGLSPATLAGAATAIVAVGVVAWLATRPGTPPQPPAPAPLAWASTMPSTDRVAAREGGEVAFAVTLSGAPREDVQYRWTLDGKLQQASGPSWAFTPGFAGGARTLDVRATASRGGDRVERAWTVDVANVGRPPRIEAPAVEQTTLEVAPGTPVELQVRASDPDAADGGAISYRWERNGERLTAASEPTLRLSDARDGEQIRVAVVDADGLEAWRAWTIVMKAPPEASVPTTRPAAPEIAPTIVELTPPPGRLDLMEGATRTFRVRATDPDVGDAVRYAWLVDGRKVASDATFELTAPADARARPHMAVQLQVADTTGKQLTREWAVSVSAARPRVESADPRAPDVTLKPGEGRAFAVRGASDREGARIRYEWTLDERPLPGAEQVALPSNLTPGRHTVQVVALDERDLRSEPRRWTVVVKAEESRGGVTPADVRAWLTQYRSAFERNDKGALVALGVAASADEAERMVKGWGEREVTLSGESIQVDGGSAKVVFHRVDKDKRNEREVPYPAALTYELVKDGGSLRAVRR